MSEDNVTFHPTLAGYTDASSMLGELLSREFAKHKVVMKYNAASDESSGVLKSGVKTTEFVEESLFPLQFGDTDMSGAKNHATMAITIPGKWGDISLRTLGPALEKAVQEGTAFDGVDPIDVTMDEDGLYYNSKPWDVNATVNNYAMLFTPPSSRSNRPKRDVTVNATVTLHCKPGEKQPISAEASTDA